MPALPDFMQQFASMFTMPTAEDLQTLGEPMIILTVTGDGIVKVRRKKETAATLLPGGMIIAVPVKVATPRAYWPSEMHDSPTCKYNDAIVGIGDNGDGESKTRECKSCPQAQWGSSTTGSGKGQACTQTKILALSCAAVADAGDHEGRGMVKISTNPDHRWWSDLYEVGTSDEGTAWKDDFSEKLGPVILRMTASSFPAWERAMEDIKKIHESKNWPLEATWWMIEWEAKDFGGYTVGAWKFRVNPIQNEQQALWLRQAVKLKDHPSLASMGDAGHEAEGVIDHV